MCSCSFSPVFLQKLNLESPVSQFFRRYSPVNGHYLHHCHHWTLWCDLKISTAFHINSCAYTETKTSTGCRVRLGKNLRHYKRRDEEIRQESQISVKMETNKYNFSRNQYPLLGAWGRIYVSAGTYRFVGGYHNPPCCTSKYRTSIDHNPMIVLTIFVLKRCAQTSTTTWVTAVLKVFI